MSAFVIIIDVICRCVTGSAACVPSMVTTDNLLEVTALEQRVHPKADVQRKRRFEMSMTSEGEQQAIRHVS